MFSKIEMELLASIGRDPRFGGTLDFNDREAQRAGLRSLIIQHIRVTGESESLIDHQI